MCKLAYIRTKDYDAYKDCVKMVQHQEDVVAGHSTGFVWRDNKGFHIRKAIGKVNSYMAKYPDIPSTKECLGHSRYATVGGINLDNQHPIPVVVKGKTIGYGIHNGTFNDYEYYEHLRTNLKNKTDSALLFILFAKMIEKIGDTKHNRRVVFGYIMSLIKHETNHNLVIMFRDGQVLFSGNVLTYKNTVDKIAIMTFGFPEKCRDDLVYEVDGLNVNKFQVGHPPFRFTIKKPKIKKITKPKSCGSLTDWNCGYNWNTFKKNARKSKKKSKRNKK